MGTGIVRRIDELGRIVIPKEMRRTMRLSEGDEMEISADGDRLSLRKYSGIESVMGTARAVVKALAQATDADVLFVDASKVLVADGANKKHYLGATLSEQFAKTVRSRNTEIIHGDALKNMFGDRECLGCYIVLEPVIACGDLVGGLALLLDGLPSDVSRAYLHFCVELIQSTLCH